MPELSFEELEQRIGRQEAIEYLKETQKPISEEEYERLLLEELGE